MRYAWAWVTGRMPIVVVRRSTLRIRERNGFELGRDYERGQMNGRLEALEAKFAELTGARS